MPIVAGILDIISGGLSFLAVGGWAVCAAMARPDSGEQLVFIILLWASVIAGIMAIVGGIFALVKRVWWLALAGSIASVFPTLVLGTIAIVLIVQSKEEFS